MAAFDCIFVTVCWLLFGLAYGVAVSHLRHAFGGQAATAKQKRKPGFASGGGMTSG